MPLSTSTILIRIYKAFRGLLVSLVIAAIIIPVAAYMLLSSDWAQNRLRDIGESELSALLGTNVKIGGVNFGPFNRLYVNDVAVRDDNDSVALRIKEVDTRFEMWDLILRKKIIIDYASVSGLDLSLYRDSIGAPLNISEIVARLSKPKPKEAPTLFAFRLNDLDLTDCKFSYDVLSAEETPERFNASHIRISDLSMSAASPVISNNDYRIRLRSLKFNEQSGFSVKDLTLKGKLTQDSLLVNDLVLALPQSRLSVTDIAVHIDSIKSVPDIAKTTPVHLALNDDSHVFLPDLKAFVPIFECLDYDLQLGMDVWATRTNIAIDQLSVSDPDGVLDVEVSGEFSDFSSLETLNFSDVNLDVTTDTVAISRMLACSHARVTPKMREILRHLGNTRIVGIADGSLSRGNVSVDVDSRLAQAQIEGRFSRPEIRGPFRIDATADVDSLMLGVLTGNQLFNRLSGSVQVAGNFTTKSFKGDAKADLSAFDFKGYRYRGITAAATASADSVHADLRIADPNISAIALAQWGKNKDGMNAASADLAVSRVYLDSLGLSKSYPGYALSGTVRADFYGKSIDRFRGNLAVSNLSLLDSKGEGARLRNLEVSADNLDKSGRIMLVSDILEGVIDGNYRFSTLAREVCEMCESLLPALEPLSQQRTDQPEPQTSDNNFSFDFTVHPCEDLCTFFNLPVKVVNPIDISGYLNAVLGTFRLQCDAEWLTQGANSYFENPDLVVDLDAYNSTGNAFFVCRTPTKKGMMDLSAHVDIDNGLLDTDIFWSLLREKPINGNIAFSTALSRDEHDHLLTQVNFKPGKINFGNEIWSIQQSQITYVHDHATIDNFSLVTVDSALGSEDTPSLPALTAPVSTVLNPDAKWILVNGVLGKETDDLLTVDLNNIQLINIFETLDIDNALISGFATGTIKGTSLLSPNPIIECDAMTIKSIGYNYCTLGDAVAHLSLDDGGKMFNFSAEVAQPTGQHSYLSGYIEPATESLNLNIDADYIKVGFMKPFMSAFTSDVKGYASGHANLYGTFKDIDMVGDIYVDSLAIKIDFTNTWYHTADSIHIRPGIIKLQNIVMHDEYDNTALLNGWVAHEFFHNASFDFNVTDARNFLCYDVPENNEQFWYGRIFGDGSVNVKGRPGIVDIKAHVTTAPNSTFTFVLSDQEVADEYQFITFRDVTPHAPTDSILDKNTTPEVIKDIQLRAGKNSDDSPTNYVMDLEVVATPQAQLIIVMDPVGGDRIKATGEGNMRMLYTSADNDIRLYGKYTLDKGSYNFTLQDIIRKDFTIKNGSAIDFSGDPYHAQLSIDAYAQINANLSDLDESFLQDKELNRTNVPVRAMLLVRGDMMQPSISFDLEFPTLTQDTYRKVKSIVSTEDMMSKQIIYLLVLNRFYTPEYMASTTKGNELFSVASSTLASQLSNMLGKLSDNWSIAPNLRSDRGDFSDIEVDVTLSSSLLNNRLLFNGNFGYRDKSLNTNQFVGDFDLEYLLNRSGEWRLKAYNRYNDQNYYLRTAQTTQGIGFVYRKDFDKTFRFLKNLPLFKREKAPVDTLIENIDITINPQNAPPGAFSTDSLPPVDSSTNRSDEKPDSVRSDRGVDKSRSR